MNRADSNLWNTANYSIKLRIAHDDHPPTLFFSACRNCMAQAGSDPLHVRLRPRSSMLSLRAIFSFQRYRPRYALSLCGYFSFQPCVDARLRPVQTLLLDYFGPNRLLSKQQNSSQLVPKHFLYFFSHMVSHAAACSLPSQDCLQGAQWIRPIINSF